MQLLSDGGLPADPKGGGFDLKAEVEGALSALDPDFGEALESSKGGTDALVEWQPAMKTIFVSHTWWHRDFVDETNDKNDKYDKGAPDWQSGEKKDLKHRVICAGVERLIEEKGLDPTKVVVWCDWPSIHQDDKAEKLKGVMSLIKYATLSHYMLVPTEEERLSDIRPDLIPGYGSRGWCRVEYFIFSLIAEMRNSMSFLKSSGRSVIRATRLSS